ncbi:MAG: hypothetical protein AAGA01_17675 [Cyanobacteria bacterium P01_E01_bin.43]
MNSRRLSSLLVIEVSPPQPAVHRLARSASTLPTTHSPAIAHKKVPDGLIPTGENAAG